MTTRGNPNHCKYPPNPVPNVPADSCSDPNLLNYSSSESSDSSNNNYYKRSRRAKKVKTKRESKTRFGDPIKKCAKLKVKLITVAHKSKVIIFKLDEDTLMRRFYFPSFLNSLKIVLSPFSEKYMLLMDYPSVREE